jgi:hypothetical protein
MGLADGVCIAVTVYGLLEIESQIFLAGTKGNPAKSQTK